MRHSRVAASTYQAEWSPHASPLLRSDYCFFLRPNQLRIFAINPVMGSLYGYWTRFANRFGLPSQTGGGDHHLSHYPL